MELWNDLGTAVLFATLILVVIFIHMLILIAIIHSNNNGPSKLNILGGWVTVFSMAIVIGLICYAAVTCA